MSFADVAGLHGDAPRQPVGDYAASARSAGYASAFVTLHDALDGLVQSGVNMGA